MVMPNTSATAELRQRVLEMVRLAEASLPRDHKADLSPDEFTQGEPDWQRFEHEIWKVGEEIRHLMNKKPSLRGDPDLLDAFLRIAQDRRAKRGRQSFVLLFAYKPCAPFATALIEEIEDPDVCGHVIHALLKMNVPGFADRIEPFTGHGRTWIRNKAKQYCARHGA